MKTKQPKTNLCSGAPILAPTSAVNSVNVSVVVSRILYSTYPLPPARADEVPPGPIAMIIGGGQDDPIVNKPITEGAEVSVTSIPYLTWLLTT